MNRKTWQLRLLILQMLAAASLIACPWLAAAWERGESWALHAGNPAVSLAYPLALGLTAYVLWALAVHLTGLTLRPRWLRAVLGGVGVLLVLSYLAGVLAYLNVLPALPVFRLPMQLAGWLVVFRGLEHPARTALVCLAMLPLALAVETGRSEN